MAKRIQIDGNSQPPIGNSSSGGSMYDAGNGYKVSHPKLRWDGVGVEYYIVLKQSEFIQLGALLMKYLGPGGQIVRMSDIPSSQLSTFSSLVSDIQDASKQQQQQGPSPKAQAPQKPSTSTKQPTAQSTNYDAARLEAVQSAKTIFSSSINTLKKLSNVRDFSDALDKYSLQASEEVLKNLKSKYNLSPTQAQALSVEAGDAIYILARNAGLVDQLFKPTGTNVSVPTSTPTVIPPTTSTPSPIPAPKPSRTKPSTPKLSPANIDASLLSQEAMQGSGDPTTSGYKALALDPMFGTQVENFTRTYGASFYRQNQVNLVPALTRDVVPKAARAKTQQELSKVIQDTIGMQTKYLNDLVTNINNSANILGTTAQMRMEAAKASDPDGKDANTQELIAFYQDKIDEIKSVEASLQTYSESVINKLSKQVTSIATKSFRDASIKRDAITQKKRDIREAKIIKKYESEFEKQIKSQLDVVAKKTAFEQAQQFIDQESAKGIDRSKVMPEAKRIYDATREEVLRSTKVESKLDRDEIIARYEQQNEQFNRQDFVSEISQFPQVLDAAKRFELEFRLGLIKSGTDILNYFTTVGQVVPQSLQKQLNKPTFSAQSGTVFGAGITDRNREAIATELASIFESAAGPAPYVAPTMKPDPSYVERITQNAPRGLGNILKYLTTTSGERNPVTLPLPGNSGGSSGGGNGTFDKGGLSFPEGGNDPKKRLGFQSLAEVYGRIDLARQRLTAASNLAKATIAVPSEILKGTEDATTSQGVGYSDTMGRFTKGTQSALKLAGAGAGAIIGGSVLGGTLGTFLGGPGLGTAAGMAIGGAAGGTVGSAIGTPFEMIPILATIADNTAKSSQAFSPEILSAKLEGQLKLLQLNIDTGQKYGSELAELTTYSNGLREEMYKLGIEFLITFKPLIEDMTALVIYIVSFIRSIMSMLYQVVEFIYWVTPILNIVRAAADEAQRWFVGSRKKDVTKGGFRNNTTAFMQNRPDNPNL